ncbi:hypothetical protein [Eisenbergiella sp.]
MNAVLHQKQSRKYGWELLFRLTGLIHNPAADVFFILAGILTDYY